MALADHHVQRLTKGTAAGRGGGRTRGTYMGHAGEKRPRNLERLGHPAGTPSTVTTIVDMSVQHEYSD